MMTVATKTAAVRAPVSVSVQRSRRSVVVRASANTNDMCQKVAVGTAALSALTAVATTPAAQAAQEAMMVAEGEPLIVQIGWAATAAMFTFSLSLVVWGRSGL
ncbi:Cytochrome b6-f complex subunit 8 [Picochlorum sp. SENEW3]|nr:Cytochrome b6-f complex subunit 8 [Picochlorum sp. SENEW3]WPT17200.1 Cytochrome b6-f complex subunit 8 [Picochlorum sp. SENEW3]